MWYTIFVCIRCVFATSISIFTPHFGILRVLVCVMSPAAPKELPKDLVQVKPGADANGAEHARLGQLVASYIAQYRDTCRKTRIQQRSAVPQWCRRALAYMSFFNLGFP